MPVIQGLGGTFDSVADAYAHVRPAIPPASCDLVYAASSFHWVPEDIGYRKVYSMLKTGGGFARFANHPDRSGNDPVLSEEIDRLYRQYYDPFYHRTSTPDAPYGRPQARERAMLFHRCALGTVPQDAQLHGRRVYGAAGHLFGPHRH